MHIILDKAAVLVSNAVSSNNDRPVLQYVAIGEDGIVAADGFILVRHPVTARRKVDGSDREPREPILIDPSDLRAAGGRSANHIVDVEDTDDGDVIIHGKRRVITTPLDAPFPNLQNVYDQLKTKPKGYIALAPKLLKKLLSCIGTDEGFIVFRIRDPQDPVEFVCGDTHGLLMPVFVDDSYDSPHWHKSSVTEDKEV